MNFDEKQFRSLADETYDKIIALGTTKGILIDERSDFVDRLVEFPEIAIATCNISQKF